MARKPRRPSALTVELENGEVIGPASRPLGDGENLEVRVLEPLGRRLFASCPICGAPATHREHVPPESIGGRWMTMTCEPCNVVLGSLVEPALSQWFHVELRSAQFRSPSFRGPRSAGQVLLRRTAEGQVVPFLDGSHHPAVDAMLAAGEPAVLEGFAPDVNLCWLALLKHSYLSFCLRFGPPAGYTADLIRRDLIAARNARKKERVHTSVLAHRLTVGRGEPNPDAPPVAEAIAYEPNGRAHRGTVMVGSIFVSWDLDMRRAEPPAVDPQISVPLMFGAPTGGAISDVQP